MVPDWRAPRHGEGTPPSPESAGSKDDRHLPSETRDLQGNPASGAGRATPEEAFRPRIADRRVPTELSGSPKGPPQPADLRPEGRCTSRIVRSENRTLRRPGGTEAPPRPLYLLRTEDPKVLGPPSYTSVEPKLLERAAPAVFRRFHVQEDARPNSRERQQKITDESQNLVHSFVRTAQILHILPTALSTARRRPVSLWHCGTLGSLRRKVGRSGDISRESGGASGGLPARSGAPDRGLALTYVALRSKSHANDKTKSLLSVPL